MKVTENLCERIRDIMSDGMERYAAEIRKLAGCEPMLMRAVLLQMTRQGVVHVVRIDRLKHANVYRLGLPSAVSPGSWWTAEQQAVNAAFHAMVCAGRRDD
ncbi:hypothetical protein LJ656_30195 [Paraburkholderia sp. MMS20-SJTR3]|uniref:Uncharacterized protein n=1 Tax=Paraburkholderia sejongensis TaxID=2886946 RepID=A0ABS8K3X2_9BURK|nr:hypothetical protein [Paraburkholderia sp. MMS20-SJTR3]MCC8396859.1 hypothetical protein [Paraburkholderia sp. MMS20-SJTR3]